MEKIEVKGPDMGDKAAAKAAVEAEIESFDLWFRSVGNEPLVNMEKALLRTYLIAKLTGQAP